MGKYAKVKVNGFVHDVLSACPYRSERLDNKVTSAVKPGTLIRDGLAKPISSPILTGLGFDGDVEGVDVEPNEPKN